MKKFFKTHWSNILFIMLILLFIIPQTRKPLQVQLNRLFAFAPSEVSADAQRILTGYHWNLRSLDGERVNFKQSEGRVAIVNLWATWCPPCIAEMPSFQKLYNDYSEKIDFYFVSSEEEETLQNFLKKKSLNLPIYQPINVAPEALNTNTLPTTYVISHKGEIVVEKKGAADWNDVELRTLLDKLLAEQP